MSINVELFSSPGCRSCGQARETLRNLVGEFGESRIEWRVVDVLEELDHAVALGVLATPAIAIDGQLRFTGLPSIRELRAEFTRRLAAKGG
ncbi:thioredoxin family protein [Sedimenticola hydrogenitrophicus]|uniref:thioredoxin family protein n=1 Tax=Sedimenticola hydrogenitrophicus TaxID=2967975 RepID=UPI0021A96674|nr:thioredoxin family protein [Sedimenticola hydrogenitrophicus]